METEDLEYETYKVTYTYNIDIFCKALLKDLCKAEGKDFQDPGTDHLRVVDEGKKSFGEGRYSVTVSRELYDRLKDSALWPYDSRKFKANGHSWGKPTNRR